MAFGSIFEGNPRVRTQKSISRTLDLSEFIIEHKPNKPAILFIQPNLKKERKREKGAKMYSENGLQERDQKLEQLQRMSRHLLHDESEREECVCACVCEREREREREGERESRQ